MHLKIENIKENPVSLMRRAGYVFQRREGEEMSFVRPLARSGYPRFHVYARLESENLIVNIHLDQKKETYGKATRHHGAYDDPIVLEEAKRLEGILRS